MDVVRPERSSSLDTAGASASLDGALVMLARITPAVITHLHQRFDTLDEQDRLFVNAAPSPLRQALRIAQIDLARTAALRLGLEHEAVKLHADEKGRPRIITPVGPVLFLSVSHNKDALAIALSANRIGVDIELLHALPHQPITMLFSPVELEGIVDDDAFTRAWVRKEAYAKWLGSGLRDALAEGVYETETIVTTKVLDDQTHYLGLAGQDCARATMTEVSLVAL
ncbi:MAG: 4'-phosphopantetheinyl transferase superfamily protein [Coriobacteriia bacterium]|nr:4'-phosphopantetheinyl transferase superfamily protein [Coriobacteriia bacterium]